MEQEQNKAPVELTEQGDIREDRADVEQIIAETIHDHPTATRERILAELRAAGAC